jgi:hypothetical protein
MAAANFSFMGNMPRRIVPAGKKKAQERNFLRLKDRVQILVASAAVAAGALGQIISHGDTTELNCLGDGLLDRFLDLVHLFLGVQEAGGHGILQEGLAVAFKLSNLGGVQGLAMMLFFLEGLALGHQGFILAPRPVISHESVNAFADPGSLHLLKDCLAQFIRF